MYFTFDHFFSLNLLRQAGFRKKKPDTGALLQPVLFFLPFELAFLGICRNVSKRLNRMFYYTIFSYVEQAFIRESVFRKTFAQVVDAPLII